MNARCETCGGLMPRGACTRCAGTIARPELLEPKKGGAVAEFMTGIDLAFRSIRLSLTRPKFASLVVLPLVLSLITFIAMVWLVWTHREAFRPDWSGPWHWSVEWSRGVLATIAEFVFVVLAFALAAFATLIVQTVLNAPFNEWLSEAAETVVLGVPDRTPLTAHKVWNLWIVPLGQAVVLATIQAVLAIVMLIASFTGVLAPLVLLGSAWLTAVSLADVAIARKSFPVRARFAIVNANLPLWLGLALPFAFVPFTLPLGVVGATLGELRERAALTSPQSRTGSR